MNKKVIAVFVLSLLAASMACELPESIPGIDTLATSVIQTLEAGEWIPGVDPTVTPTVPPACPQAAVLTIVYTDGGNVWKIQGPNPPVQLTFGGTAATVLLSGDGEKVAFTTLSPTWDEELRVVNIDGSGETVLLSQAEIDGLVPPEPNSIGNNLWDIMFKPCSQDLYFNLTASFMGPGHFTYDYLHSIDTNTGVVSMILPAGSGGEIYFSPDATRMAISRPTSISFANIDGSGYLPDVHTFPAVITYSEFQWSPPVRWASDSGSVGLAMPGEEPFLPTSYADMWIIPADGSPATLLGTITGKFYFNQYAESSFSPDLSQVVFTEEDLINLNYDDLYFANLDGSGITSYDYAKIDYQAWSPDSQNIAYGYQDPGGSFLKIGGLGSPPLTLDTGDRFRDSQWVSNNRILYLRGFPAAQDLVIAVLGSGPTTLASPVPVNGVDFDFAPKP